jgi:hypothetical protein
MINDVRCEEEEREKNELEGIQKCVTLGHRAELQIKSGVSNQPTIFFLLSFFRPTDLKN